MSSTLVPRFEIARRAAPRPWVVVAVVMALLLGFLGWRQVGWRVVHGSASHADSLPASASARTVLDAYLTALVAGDCDAASSFATSTFVVGNGELCGAADVTSAVVQSGPSLAGGGFAVTLRYDHGDASMPPGGTIWFYNLRQDAAGRWQLNGGGSAP